MRNKLLILPILSLITLGCLLAPVAVNAIESETDETPTTNITTETETEGDDEVMTTKRTPSETVKARLTTAKLRICEKRETAVKATITRVADRDNKRMMVFSGITDKLVEFVAKKGLETSNFIDLIATVNEKKAAVQTVIETYPTQGKTFSCDEIDPKAAVSKFKLSHTTTTAALKEYKTAVQNLITAIKTSINSSTTTEESL